MSLRRRSLTDSLQLLVDTICNLFGSIVIISLLMAVLSKDTPTDANANPRATDLQRQLQETQTNLDEARQLQTKLNLADEDARRLALAVQIAELKTTSASNESLLKSNAIIVAAAPPANANAIQDLLKRQSALESDLKTATNELDRLKLANTRLLRLPRERATGKKTFYIIVRYGKLYPVHLIRAGRREINNQTIDWRQTPDGEIATPRRELGFDPSRGLAAFARLFTEIPSDTYSIHFLVYDDSFPAFLLARKIPLARSYDTGWEFFSQGRPIVFSSSGEAPPAL